MRLRLFRNATMHLSLGGTVILTDPYLAPKFSRPSYAGRSPNPLVDLPAPAGDIVAGMDCVILSHLHSDHFDPAARDLLAKDAKILCQPGDKAQLEAWGFTDVRPVDPAMEFGKVTLTRIPGRHGSGEVLSEMGQASGFVLSAPGAPTLYWVGDSVWCPEVAEAIDRFKPDLIITHSCGATWGPGTLIVMDAAQTVEVCRRAPQARVVAVHMEALDHASVTRRALRAFAEAEGIGPATLLIPADGEELELGL